ncbi:MAG: B12-binding domain-containing radical SAM protein [Candidatus Omnitrophica bacterium]|nr:B12-binding domain-containing radical SAM protein [Candidatus Omnitrophota bacterium]
MRILFILASDLIYKYQGFFTLNNGFAPLSLTTLAACVPEKYNARLEIVDEGMQRVDYDRKISDIVVISCCASSSNRAYTLASYWKGRGAYTVIGGVHATLCPDDVASHADTIITGYGEAVFAKFLEDFVQGIPRKVYNAKYESSCLSSPIPRRDLIKHIRYYFKNTVVANRGCANSCRFCSIGKLSSGQGMRRPVGEVIDEIRKMKFKKVHFVDPSPISDIEYAKEFFSALIPLKIKYFINTTVTAVQIPGMLDLMRESGCFEVLIGFESFNQQNLSGERKEFNNVGQYKEVVRCFHDRNIAVLGSFVLGMDNDNEGGLLKIPDLVQEINVDLPRFTILTPFPGTPLFDEYKSQGRLMTDNFDYYDLMHTVHRPKRIEPKKLQEVFCGVWQRSYSLKYLIKRMSWQKTNRVDMALQNLYFKHLGRKIPKTIDYIQSCDFEVNKKWS